MKKFIIITALVFSGFTLEAQLAYNSTQSSSHTVMIDLQNTVSIIMGSAYAIDANLDKVRTNDPSFIVKSNRPWAITVNSDASTVTAEDVNPVEAGNDAGNYRNAVVYTATRL